ncbi:hypothetical protein KP803_11610 [Vibrio sp. ZSDE26]|uniref:Uncharacterized protein n=1 Tax=Vibrio amylolyticus TaxID=2847292 RepID=A0A9X2BHF4_9VIBR|nr:hypothetical protein [Vibrio amylolyticus]MCK6263916.1 hypothetical protein [Vibrio amylolyticus]
MYDQITDSRLLAKGQRVAVNDYDNKQTPYRFQLGEDTKQNVIALILWDESKEKGGHSITNSAERVLNDVLPLCPKTPNIIVYKDTTGRWDRLYCRPDKSKRLRFVSIGPIRTGTPSLWEDCIIFSICLEVFILER